MLGFPFQSYQLFNEFRDYGKAFLLGANSSKYAPNISVCYTNLINLAQYDVDLLMIKYMFGTVKQNILNTTLFLKNVTDLSYTCLDSLENLYVYNMYKFNLFGYSWTNVALGGLQNLLGSILTINKVY